MGEKVSSFQPCPTWFHWSRFDDKHHQQDKCWIRVSGREFSPVTSEWVICILVTCILDTELSHGKHSTKVHLHLFLWRDTFRQPFHTSEHRKTTSRRGDYIWLLEWSTMRTWAVSLVEFLHGRKFQREREGEIFDWHIRVNRNSFSF